MDSGHRFKTQKGSQFYTIENCQDAQLSFVTWILDADLKHETETSMPSSHYNEYHNMRE
jgi:hypothetical protein